MEDDGGRRSRHRGNRAPVDRAPAAHERARARRRAIGCPALRHPLLLPLVDYGMHGDAVVRGARAACRRCACLAGPGARRGAAPGSLSARRRRRARRADVVARNVRPAIDGAAGGLAADRCARCRRGPRSTRSGPCSRRRAAGRDGDHRARAGGRRPAHGAAADGARGAARRVPRHRQPLRSRWKRRCRRRGTCASSTG